MPSVRLTLWLSKKEPDGKAPIYLVLRHRGERAVRSLPVRVSPRHWNERQCEVRRTLANARELNRFLYDQKEKAETELQLTVIDGKANPCRRAKAILDGNDAVGGAFFPYAEELRRGYLGRGQISTAKSIGSALVKLEEFGGRKLSFDDLSETFFRRFASWMAKERGNKPNTVHKSMSHLRTIWLQAQRENMVEGNPFSAVRIKKEKALKPKLTLDQIRALERVPCEGLLRDAQQYFLFAFYAGGLRFSDVALLKEDSIQKGPEWRLLFRQKKTGDPAGVLLVPQARAILEAYSGISGYCFPIMRTSSAGREVVFREIGNRNSYFNKKLKKLAALAGLDVNLSFHLARHSLADHMRKSGASIYDISKALGHANTQITEAYLRGFDQDALDETMRRLF